MTRSVACINREVSVLTIVFKELAQLFICVFKLGQKQRFAFVRCLRSCFQFFDLRSTLVEKGLKYKLTFRHRFLVVGRHEDCVLWRLHVGCRLGDHILEVAIHQGDRHHEFNLLGLVVTDQVDVENALASCLQASQDRTILYRLLDQPLARLRQL